MKQKTMHTTNAATIVSTMASDHSDRSPRASVATVCLKSVF